MRNIVSQAQRPGNEPPDWRMGLRTWLSSVLTLMLLVAFHWKAQAQQRLDIFGGYSYMHTATEALQEYFGCPVVDSVPTCPTPLPNYNFNENLSGWEATVFFKSGHRLGAAADFSGNYGSSTLTSPAYGTVVTHTHLYTYLVGPQMSWPGRFSPFVRVLVGAAHESQSSNASAALYDSPSGTSFAAAFGGGIDIKLTSRLSIRPIQFQELLTGFNSGYASPHRVIQYQPELSAGLVLHF